MRIGFLALAAAALVAALPSTADAKQRPLRLRETCVTRAERNHVVRFRGSDGVRLIGVMLGRGPRAVVLAHQGASDLCIWLPYARTLAARGYRVLVFDHRGFGSSGRASRATRKDRVDYDVLGAIATVRRRGATSVVLGGASLGGAAVLSAAALATPAVNGVISFSSPTVYIRVNALRAVRALAAPALFLAMEEDHPFSEEAREMYDACGTPAKQVRIFPGFDHGVFMLQDPQVLATVDEFIALHSE
jgi:alpha-beta hydrolase superfamily lysophospholipase